MQDEDMLLNIVKVLLDEGWAIHEQEFFILLDAIEFEPNFPTDSGLVQILKDALKVNEPVYEEYLKSRGILSHSGIMNIASLTLPVTKLAKLLL